MHDPAMPMVVVDRVVLRGEIVPECQRARTPTEAAGELGLGEVTEEIVQQRPALGLCHATEALGVRDVYIERLATGLGVRAQHGVLRLEDAFATVFRRRTDAIFTGARNVGFGGAVDGGQALER